MQAGWQRRTVSNFVVLALVATALVAAPARAPAGTGEDLELVAATAAPFERLSLTPDGGQFPEDAFRSAASADGRYVAFEGRSPGGDVYVRDRLLGTTELISMAQVGSGAGGRGNGHSSEASISADGRYVAFLSRASNLVSGDGNGLQDVFVRDRVTGTIQRVGRRSSPSVFEMDDEMASISGDGRWVTFVTEGLEWWGFSLRKKVYVVQRGSFSAELVSRDPRDHVAVHPRLDASGSRVAYLALIGGNWVLVLHDRATGTYQELATIGPGSSDFEPGTLHPFLLYLGRPSVSPDGRTIAYLTYSDDRTKSRVEVWEEGQGSTVVFETDASVTGQKVESPSLSADGQRVLFTLVDGVHSGGVITLGQGQVHVHDRVTGQTSLVSSGADGEPVAGDARYSAMSGDGSLATFSTTGALDPGDTNDRSDVYAAVLAPADTSAPTWPDGAALTVEDVGTTVVRLRWPDAVDDVGVTGYAVSAGGTQVAVTAATELPVTGLSPATTYEFAVTPRDAAGNTGEPLTASATTLEEASDGEATLVATAEPGGVVRLHWDAATDGAGGYTVQRAAGEEPFTDVATTAETSHTDTGLLSRTTYRYRVLAVGADGVARPHTVEASATTPAMSIQAVEWTAPRIPRTNEVRLGADLTVTVRGEPNRAASVDIAHEATGAGGPEPAQAVLTLDLDEREPGVYRASVPVPEGVAEITGIVARLSDGVAEHDVTAPGEGLPVMVGGLVVARVDAPAGSLPGARLFAWSEEAKTGHQFGLDGGGEFEIPVSPAGYTLRVLRADGVLATEVEVGQVGHGNRVVVDLTPDAPAALVARVVDDGGAPVPDVRVRITDEVDGKLVATSRTGGDGATGAVAGLTWRTHLRVTAEVDPLGYETIDQTVVLDHGDNEVTVLLSARPRGWVEGQVVDQGGAAVPKAAVRVHQVVGGIATSAAATSDEQGRYRVETFAGDGEVSAWHHNGTPVATSVVVPAGGGAVADFALPSLRDYQITLDVHTRYAGGGWQGPLPIDWVQAAHLGLRVHDPAMRHFQSRAMAVRGQPGQRIQVCATAAHAGLSNVCKDIVLGTEPTVPVELRLAQPGLVQAHLVTAAGTDHQSGYTALLSRVEADGSRRLVQQRAGLGTHIAIPVDQPGEHELVVTTGELSSLPVRVTVPEFGVSDAGRVVLAARGPFTGAGNALEATRPVVLPGDVVEWRTSFRNGGTAALTGAVALLPVPAGTEVVAGGTLLDGQPVSGVVAGGYLEVPLGTVARGGHGVLRHRVRLVRDGLLAVGGTALIRADGLAPSLVGNDSVTVASVTLEAPSHSVSHTVAASGRAPSGSEVEILAGDMLVARTVAVAGGYWHAEVELPDRGQGYEHVLTARSLIDGSLIHSPPAFVTVDGTVAVMTSVSVQQPSGRRVTFDPTGAVARFPYTWVPDQPMIVDVTFSDPDRVEDVVVRIGDETRKAQRQPSGVYRASVPGGRGDLFIDFDRIGAPLALDDPDANPVPTGPELRSRLSSAFAGFTDVTVVESAGSGRSALTARLPSLGPDAGVSAEMSMARDQTYTPTAADREAERVSGAPVYGLSWQDSPDGLSSQLVAYIPEHALAGGATVADVLAMVTQAAAATPSGGWRGGGGSFAAPGTLAQAQVAVPAARVSFQWAFHGVTGLDDVRGHVQKAGIFDRMSRLLDQLSDCPADVITAYTNRLDNMARAAAIVQVTQGVMAVAGLFMGPATFGLGTLALWATTSAVKAGMDYAIEHNFGRLKREIEDLPCVKGRRGKKYAEPVWIHDPSGFVYEAVASNRLEGVTATVMHAPSPGGPWTVWDAEWFGQDNPQETGSDGRYGWDVPEGWWMVAYEKEGYLTAYSDALEVLPPHFDVDEGLVPVAPPSAVDVTAAGGPDSSVLVTFDQYMRAGIVEAVGVEVAVDGGARVAGEVLAAGVEESPSGERLATRFRFTPAVPLEAGTELTVTVPDVVQNHAGRTMTADVVLSVLVSEADGDAPAASATVSPAANAAGWHRDSVVVELSATDGGSGVAELAWTLSGAQDGAGSATGDSTSVTVTAEGETTVTFHAVDRAGNAGEPGQVTVRIDRTPPGVTCRATPALLWPPNHRLVDVAVAVEVHDTLSGPGGVVLAAATSSDPDNAPRDSDGNTTGDVRGWELGTADLHGQLRAERDELVGARVYTLRYEVHDVAGNSSTCGVPIIVPLDREGSRGQPAGAPASAPR